MPGRGSQPIRVLWFGHNLAYPPVRGVLQRNYNLLSAVANGCETHVLAFDQPATRPTGVTAEDCANALRKFCANVEWIPVPRGVTRGSRYWLALRSIGSAEPFAFQWLRCGKMADRLRKTLWNLPFDVIHFDTIGLASYRPLLETTRAILNHHNIESSMMARRSLYEGNWLLRRYWLHEASKIRGAEQRWCPQFKVNVVVSNEDADALTEIIPGIETALVPNGVDTDYFTPRPDPGGKTLLFCGGLDWYPNREAMKFFFDRIWPRLIARFRDITIYVVGRRPPKWLHRLSVKDQRVRLTGFVPDVRPYFQKATAYVCPIRNGGGTRLKILDALAMGVPMVATSFACSGLSLVNGKHVLVAETPEEFVSQIDRAFSNEMLRTTLAATGRDIVERNYSWRVAGKRLIDVYKRALEQDSK